MKENNTFDTAVYLLLAIAITDQKYYIICVASFVGNLMINLDFVDVQVAFNQLTTSFKLIIVKRFFRG